MEDRMKQNFSAGMQHIGIPTNDMNVTIDFYRSLGFEPAFETVLRDENCRVCFLKLGNMVIEAYENHQALHKAGAIDHISLDCTDIEAAFEFAKKGGYRLLGEGIEELPFWEKGVRFFKIEGPNRETLEFCQRL
jgi:catechol 2,3-dioxygenase-like lactoylglutathione lyase family enzyme